MARVEIVTLTTGARAKEGKGGGGGEKKNTLLSPRPLLAPFVSPHLLPSSGSFNMALSRANWALREYACIAGYLNVFNAITQALHKRWTLRDDGLWYNIPLHIKKVK